MMRRYDRASTRLALNRPVARLGPLGCDTTAGTCCSHACSRLYRSALWRRGARSAPRYDRAYRVECSASRRRVRRTLDKPLRRKLQPVVDTHGAGATREGHEFVHHPDASRLAAGAVDNIQRLAIASIEDHQQADPSPLLQRVGYVLPNQPLL